MTSLIPGDPSFQFPSGSSGGSSHLEVTATSSGTAQTYHTAVTGTDDVDYVTVWAANIDGATNYNLTLELDGQTYGPFTIPRLSVGVKVLDGVPMNNATTVKAFASAASKIVLTGKIIRIAEGAA